MAQHSSRIPLDDLAEAVEEAQDLGMKVVLVGLGNPDHHLGVTSVAEHLALRVDSIITLPAELIESCFTKSVAAAPRPTPEVPAAPSAAPVPRPAAGSGPRPTPPSLRPAIGPAAPRTHRLNTNLVYSSGGAGATYATPDESAMDVAEDVGAGVAVSWYGTITQGELNELLADRPVLPVEIDRVLLKDCAQRIGEYKTDFQGIRRALREAFWQKLDELI